MPPTDQPHKEVEGERETATMSTILIIHKSRTRNSIEFVAEDVEGEEAGDDHECVDDRLR